MLCYKKTKKYQSIFDSTVYGAIELRISKYKGVLDLPVCFRTPALGDMQPDTTSYWFKTEKKKERGREEKKKE